MPKNFASGADARFVAAFEDSPGVIPSTGWRYIDLVSTTLGAEEPFGKRPILGRGRDPGDPFHDRRTVDGEVVIPFDAREVGFWLKGLLGTPDTAQTHAYGWFEFSAQPAADSTITLNGTVWTLKASGASGTQTDLGVDLDATLTALANDLNASANTEVAKCTYTANTTLKRLEIEFDATGAGGNTYTLSASATSKATRSAATLLAGGYKHTFLSGGDSLPTMTIEKGFPGLVTPVYKRYNMFSCGEMTFSASLTGAVNANIKGLARDESESPVTVEENPTEIALDAFFQKDGAITVNGNVVPGIMGGNFSFNNTLDPLFTFGGGVLMQEATATIVACSGDLNTRVASDAVLRQLAVDRDPIEVTYGYTTSSWNSILFTMPRVFVSLPREPISGPGGIDITVAWESARDSGLDAALKVELINDQASY